MPPTSRPRLRVGFTARMMQQARMLRTNRVEQPKTPVMDSWADVVANIDRDTVTVDSSSDERISVLSSIGEQCIYAEEFRLLLKKKKGTPKKMRLGGKKAPKNFIRRILVCTDEGAGASTRTQDLAGTAVIINLLAIRAMPRFTKKKGTPVCCVWFEPTPWMDTTQGLLKTIYVNKMVKAGYIVKILIADWFAQRNHNICSNKYIIRNIGCYNIEIWKATGMDLSRVELVWFSDVLERHAADYWLLALDVSRKCTLKRMASCCADTAPYGPLLPAAEIFYPCMQVAAILCQKLQADIWLFSMDQRDTVMLTREYCEDTKRETKPTIMLHNTLPNLVHVPYIPLKGLYNRRDPKWNIFMHDNEVILNRKIRRDICPPKGEACNPCLEYIKYAIFPWFWKFEVLQKERNGTIKAFSCMEDLIVEYECGNLDPVDVKLAFEKGIYKILEHVGNCINSNAEAQALITALMDQTQPTESAHLQTFHW